ncbi:MAG: DNA ligase-associated DEXH box helicase [Rhodospirillaceae bacterium]|nr:DNA ligase-associated DEXH box helicase [Rhodospirillaceae bacterium]|tara:strand:- start:4453 stop:5460 length:1008 start_codon:yes stop_codon:yes gene_type:complete
MSKAPSWLKSVPGGLYCEPGDFWVDPTRAVDRAMITHGHADHARPGHNHVLATAETLAIMKDRYGDKGGISPQALRYGEGITVGDVRVSFSPAGHVLGSAQAVLEHRGERIVVSGDYKRRRDPTCATFEPVGCDLFITEATFALPVFRHPDDRLEMARLLGAREIYPGRALLVGAYSLGKAQRIICLLRETGYNDPIYIHGALEVINETYRRFGIDFGDLRPVMETPKDEMAGAIVVAPPSTLNDRWSRRLPDPVTCFASGWMGVRARARQRGVELPLVISDHADWDELNRTLDDVAAPHVWVTHGAEEALIHAARQRGFDARALSMAGYDEASE